MRAITAVVFLAASFGHALHAAPPDDRAARALQLVQQALESEIEGSDQARADLLAKAASYGANQEAVRWAQGEIRVGDRWQTYEQAVEEASRSATLARYRKERDAAKATLNDQIKLARFCDANGLREQARAHWSAVLEFDANHAEARKRLKFENVNGRWIRPADAEVEQAMANRVASALRTEGGRLRGMLAKLKQGEMTPADITNQLSANADIAQIPVWEAILSTSDRDAAMGVVQTLAQMDAPEASVSLVRLALSSPWSDVQDEATRLLKSRDEHSSLPPLLAELRGPWIGGRQITAGAGGSLSYRFTLVADGKDRQTLRVLEEEYFLRGDQALAGRQAERAANFETARLENRRQQENRLIEQRNEQVMALLAELTGQEGFDSPQDWWKWWDDRNGVYTSGGKGIDSDYRYDSTTVTVVSAPAPIRYGQTAIVDPPPSGLGRSSTPRAPQRVLEGHWSRRPDCLASGTPILTNRGAINVERIRVGDLVLSQHPTTGEVAFKAVLTTTRRSPEPLLRIEFEEGDAIVASGGHPFWVSGRGWLRVGQLEPGMRLHGHEQFAVVRQVVVESQPSRSYNLIVADFHSYFVGPGRVLSHDNTVAEPVRVKVPGLQ